MRLSRFFLPILREPPKEAEIVSHRLMLRAGMMRQESAGIYAFLPLCLRVLKKICEMIDAITPAAADATIHQRQDWLPRLVEAPTQHGGK